MRTMVFEMGAVILLPAFLGINGIWGSVTVAETASCVFSWFFIFRMNRRYRYLRGSFDPETE
jgi:Na+-driven multidrug efflux pump